MKESVMSIVSCLMTGNEKDMEKNKTSCCLWGCQMYVRTAPTLWCFRRGSANPHSYTHQTTLPTTPCVTTPQQRIHKICEPSNPYTSSRNSMFGCMTSPRPKTNQPYLQGFGPSIFKLCFFPCWACRRRDAFALRTSLMFPRWDPRIVNLLQKSYLQVHWPPWAAG